MKISLTPAPQTLASLGAGTAATKAAIPTRSWFHPARPSSVVDGGLNTQDGSAPSLAACIQLADAATQGFYFETMVPADAVAAQPLSAAVYFHPDATDAVVHAVQWRFNALALTAGTAANAAGTTTAFTGAAAAKTSKQMVIEAAQQVLPSVSALQAIRFSVYRLGADAADSYVGAVNVIGVRFDYTASL